MAKGGNKKRNPFWNSDHYSFSKFAVVSTLVFAVILCFFARDNVIRWIRADAEIRAQQKQMLIYRNEIDEMNRQIQMLTHEKDSLEQFAREQFHFAAPGDDVYLEPDAANQQPR